MSIINKYFDFCAKCVSSEKSSADNELDEYKPTLQPIGDVIFVKEIDPCLYVNGTEHHTAKYELMKRQSDPQLVIRRGQPFKLHVTLSRPYDEEKDKITFVFSVKDKKTPNYGRGTLVSVSLAKEADTVLSWSAVLENTNENIITVRITPASDSIVGKWNMSITTRSVDMYTFNWETNVYILFNPWCVEDHVYMESEEWRQEAVLNSDGLIWRGSYSNFHPAVWKYDQFEKNVLDCALYLVTEIGKIAGNFRSDPVHVSRALSAAVNVQDDNGVVVGNWSNNYSGGTPPAEWTGSFDILQKYYDKKKPVRYGQCWVFAGVLTTVCRALGIPSRVVTNFSSAHDSDGSITIDHFVDEDGKIVEEYTDSVWNFHVWNEAWMCRPDLGMGYSGWQAIDSTPQERSNGMFRCGPASVVACKEGDVKKPYDIPFVYAEVNADMLYWYLDSKTNSLKLLGQQTESIGKFISTKAAGRFERLDITDSYKHKEDTAEERAINLKAMSQLDHKFSKLYVNENFADVIFKLGYLDDILIGQPFDVNLKMTNENSSQDHTVDTTLRVDVFTYTGKLITTVKTQTYNVKLNQNSMNQVNLNVSFDDYYKDIVDNCVFKISCLAHVQDTSFHYYERDDFRITMPNVQIQLNGSLREKQEIAASVTFRNPLPIPIKNCYFLVDAPGVGSKLKLKVKDKIQPGKEVVQNVKFTPRDSGRQTIAAKFVSKELKDVNGFYPFVVEGNVLLQ